MTRRPTTAPVLLALAFALVSCAAPHGQTTDPSRKSSGLNSPQPGPAYKQPVRMNGRGAITTIPLADFFTLQQSGKALIFDARPAFFYGLGHIAGAINLSKNGCDEAIHARETELKAAVAAGSAFEVAANSGFTITVDDGICEYICSFLPV